MKRKGKDEVVQSISKRFDTVIIGALSVFEEYFPELKKNGKWQDVRSAILDKGNREKRLAVELLAEKCIIQVKPDTIVFKKTPHSPFLRLSEVDGRPIDTGTEETDNE